MQDLNRTPAGMIGWMDEVSMGEAMELSDSKGAAVKLVVTPEGIVAFALADRAEDARALLELLGFRPETVRRMLCG